MSIDDEFNIRNGKEYLGEILPVLPVLEEPLPLPRDIYTYLDQFVHKQHNYKKTLATIGSAYLHNVKLCNEENVDMRPMSFIVAGPTGTGKTYAASLLAETLDIPFFTIDCSGLSAAGYKGTTLQDRQGAIYPQLIAAVHDEYMSKKVTDQYLFPYILLLDEIDKVLLDQYPGWSNKIQAEMLKLLESGIKYMETRGGDSTSIDTDNFSRPLIIFAGSFMSSKNQNQGNNKTFTIGVGKDIYHNEAAKEKLTGDALVKYGVIPELVGRTMALTETESLNKEDLVSILIHKNGNALNSIINTFRSMGLSMTEDEGEDLVYAVVEDASEDNRFGARDLYKLLWSKVEDKLFNA